MNKTLVRDQILARLNDELALQTRAARLSREEAISEESKPENQYDMHSQEAAYLAEGQARLAAEIATSVEIYTSLAVPPFPADAPVAVGAIVTVETGGKRAWYFVGPRGGGMEVQIDGQTILVVTPQSPLGRELLGKRVGDPVKIPGRTPTSSKIVGVV